MAHGAIMSSSVPSPSPGPSEKVPPAVPTAQDWMLLGLITVLGASGFAGIKVSVETAPPSIVAAGRIWVGAALLYLYMKATGRKLPPLKEQGGGWSPLWGFAAAVGVASYTFPMFVIPVAQLSVSSLLAGIYMAFMPIATVVLAALFADEPLTRQKLAGAIIGTLGVIFLIGPMGLQGIFTQSVFAQLLLILGATGYAVGSVITRRAPEAPARSFATMMMLTAGLAATPLALMDLRQLGEVSITSWLGIIYLGVVPTGMTSIMIILVVRRVGAGFMALCNYLIPIMAIIYGVVLFGETLAWRYAIGLCTILVGIALVQPGAAKGLLQSLRQIIGKA